MLFFFFSFTKNFNLGVRFNSLNFELRHKYKYIYRCAYTVLPAWKNAGKRFFFLFFFFFLNELENEMIPLINPWRRLIKVRSWKVRRHLKDISAKGNAKLNFSAVRGLFHRKWWFHERENGRFMADFGKLLKVLCHRFDMCLYITKINSDTNNKFDLISWLPLLSNLQQLIQDRIS